MGKNLLTELKNHSSLTKDDPFVKRLILMASSKKHVVIDCFAGGGGTSKGFKKHPDYFVLACINHWHKAILSHFANFPDCLHLEEDFRSANLDLINYMISEIKKLNPDIKIHIWFSYECINFSYAKGGLPRDADSRTLPEDGIRYLKELNPDHIWIENVKEFMLWGPMIPKVQSIRKGKKHKIIVPLNVPEDRYYDLLIQTGHVLVCPLVKNKKDKTLEKWLIPDPHFKGVDYDKWVKSTTALGYDYHYKLINCADVGCPTTRTRLFIQFPRSGSPVFWPRPTYNRNGTGGLQKWKAVKHCLDLNDLGESALQSRINKKGELKWRITSDKSVDRLIAGTMKHALKGENTWLTKYNSAKNNSSVNAGASINSPSPTVAAQVRMALTNVQFINQAYSGNNFSRSFSPDDPARTITAKGGNLSLVSPQFLNHVYGNGFSTPLSSPNPTMRTKDCHYIISPLFFVNEEYSTSKGGKSIDEPVGSLLSNPKQKLIQVDRVWMMDTNYNNNGRGLDDPSKTITADRRQFYIISYQFNNAGRGIERPAETLLARMDKKPAYLVVIESGEIAIEVYETDPPHIRKLKSFMAYYGIIDIKMRMLKIEELKMITTFPEDYILLGTQEQQKKMIGNAVPPLVVYEMAAAYEDGWNDYNLKQAA